METIKKNKTYYKAFKTIFEKALQIDSGNHNEQITVVYDESFVNFFSFLLQVVNDMRLSVTYIYLPFSYQNTLQNNSQFLSENEEILLPTGLKAAISDSDIVLSFLNGSLSTSKVRGAILNQRKQKKCKVIHCPGLSEDVLHILLRSPFDKILQQSELMAWALGVAEACQVKTWDRNGNEHLLNLELNGWDNDPLMSPGIIFEGSWGNVPPGETFCCPQNLSCVNGSICINGSLPNILLEPDEEVILYFTEGKITYWETKTDSRADQFFNNNHVEAVLRGDHNWNAFAELGIGLNTAIQRLTGNSLFDEKMGGTIHIAIGDNVNFGHNISSFIHADMVVLNPNISLNGYNVIEGGVINELLLKQWRQSFLFDPISIDQTDYVYINGSKITIELTSSHAKKRQWILKRNLFKGDRVGYVKVMTCNNALLIELLQESLDREVLFRDLSKKAGIRYQDKLKKMLEILLHYKAAEIIKQ